METTSRRSKQKAARVHSGRAPQGKAAKVPEGERWPIYRIPSAWEPELDSLQPVLRMPAEWEPHASTWIAWPHNEEDWPGKFAPIPWVYADIVRNLAAVEKVNIIIGAQLEAEAKRILKRANASLHNVVFHRWPTDRVWTRDSGPIFVKAKTNAQSSKEQVLALDWRFNGWAKYSNWKKDNELPRLVAKKLRVPTIAPALLDNDDRVHYLVLEGGSIDVNGRGAMLTTEECLLSKVQQRNPGVSRSELETAFSTFLGVTKVIWLGDGIVGDDTHGHVDDLARFVSPNTVVTVIERDPADANYAALQDNCKRLRSATDQDGKRLRVVELPMPSPVLFEGRRLPASYANFYIANGLVLVPTFNDANDRIALNTLAELFPDRKVVGIHCGDFIWGFGALHCMTQQEPK